eukprot:scaffold241022_cov46-Prasinocladus_malaysianus.AAC.1
MGVYCGAHSVLCIRSREPEASRYHQRAWTLQEFCSARRIVMVDEPEPTDAMVDTSCPEAHQLRAFKDSENEYFSELRRDIQGQIPSCRPFWLCGGFTADTPLDV